MVLDLPSADASLPLVHRMDRNGLDLGVLRDQDRDRDQSRDQGQSRAQEARRGRLQDHVPGHVQGPDPQPLGDLNQAPVHLLDLDQGRGRNPSLQPDQDQVRLPQDLDLLPDPARRRPPHPIKILMICCFSNVDELKEVEYHYLIHLVFLFFRKLFCSLMSLKRFFYQYEGGKEPRSNN